MEPALRRDGVLAVSALVTLVGLGVITARPGIFFRPLPVLVGIVGALLLEALFFRYPEQTRALWEHPGSQALGVGLVIAIGLFAVRSGLDWMVAALAWGLIAYLGLLTVVAVGYPNPVGTLIKHR